MTMLDQTLPPQTVSRRSALLAGQLNYLDVPWHELTLKENGVPVGHERFKFNATWIVCGPSSSMRLRHRAAFGWSLFPQMAALRGW